MPLLKDVHKVLVIGSGPIIIGQAAEFDYAGTQACLALKEEGIEVVLVNNNPATIMTDQTIADKVYIEPLTTDCIEEIIKKEKPDGLIGTLGGQTGLNLTVQLHEKKILQKYNVTILGSSVDSIQRGEDRDKFRQLMLDINEPIPESKIVTALEEGLDFAQAIGYPVIIRPAYTLGGTGGGFASNDEELKTVLKNGLNLSPIHQCLVEKSIRGWKEIEYEVMRDANDTCIIVCNMENIDPVGVHTGDSMVVAPSQTLTDRQYQMLRNSSLKIIRSLGVIGGCNIQFALDPFSDEYYIIEVNPRVSRSSALASKATGYPIARMATKCAIGFHLDELTNPITGNTYAAFEPAIDYVVIKIPRFPFDKFTEADRTLGTQMKATGEVMAIDRSFEGALNKGLRSLEMKTSSLIWNPMQRASETEILKHLDDATDLRLFAVAEGHRRGLAIQSIYEKTWIDPWFLEKLKNIVELEDELLHSSWDKVSDSLLIAAKKKNVGDKFIAYALGVSEQTLRAKWKELNLQPGYKLVDTCAGEFDAVTPYYYSTWQGQDEVEPSVGHKILVIGSGPIRIGQGIEFDYCSVQAALAVKKKGYQAIVINNNPETVSTDYSIADRLYFEPLAIEDILNVVEKEKVEGVLIQFGGQTAINVARELVEAGVNVLGTSIENVDKLEDRKEFYQLLSELDIPHISGETVASASELQNTASQLGFPVLVRPSYVIGGQSMFIFHRSEELASYVKQLEDSQDERIWPILVDKYIAGIECEIDVICDGKDIIVPGVFEHIERAGVHSGDSITAFPAISLSDSTKNLLVDYATKIADKLPVIGLMNIQFVVSEDVVYVLEVNPRASRTVPIMSKVTKVPMVEIATLVQLGANLKDLHSVGLLPEPDFYSVKAPIFSAPKLRHVDFALGPEMKSTGEVLGLGKTLAESLEKAIFLDGNNPFHYDAQQSYVLCSIAEREKEESLPYIKEIVNRGFKILATEGTVNYLRAKGIKAELIGRNKGKFEERLRNGDVAAFVNIPSQGRIKDRFGFYLREQAVRFQIPLYTCLDTFKTVLKLKKDLHWDILSIDQYTDNRNDKKELINHVEADI